MIDEITVLYLDDIYNMLHNLTMKMAADGIKPDIIVGISRGGLVVSRLLSDILGINNVQIIGVNHYKGIGETKKELKLTQDITTDISGKIVLLVDDVSDTGKKLTTNQNQYSNPITICKKLLIGLSMHGNGLSLHVYTTRSNMMLENLLKKL